RNRIAGAPDRELRRRIVGTRLPEATAAGLPGVVFVLPGLAPRLARLGHYVPAPQLFSRSRVECRDPAPCLRIAGAVRHDHLALGGNRRGIEPLSGAEFIGA